MTRREQPQLLLWIVRGTTRGQDVSIVVEASSPQEAEYLGWKRGIPVVIVSEATPADVAAAKQMNCLYRYSPFRGPKAFGTPVTIGQTVILMLAGIAAVLINLKVAQVPLHF